MIQKPRPEDRELKEPPDDPLDDAIVVRSELMFATSPLLAMVTGGAFAGLPPLALDRRLRFNLPEVVGRFISGPPPASSGSVSLLAELQLFVRLAFSYPEMTSAAFDGNVEKGITGGERFAGHLGRNEELVKQLLAEVVDLRIGLHGGTEGLFFYDDVPTERRTSVKELLDTVRKPREDGGDRDDTVLIKREHKVGCIDDRGRGRDAMVELHFSGRGALEIKPDMTEPQQWPELFPSAWVSVSPTRPWRMMTFDRPGYSGRSTSIQELVVVPPPFDAPVLLNVARIQYRPEVAAAGPSAVAHRVLLYALGRPHEGFTEDSGIVFQGLLGGDPDVDDPTNDVWYGVTYKRLAYRSSSYAQLTQLVCGQWLRMVKRLTA